MHTIPVSSTCTWIRVVYMYTQRLMNISRCCRNSVEEIESEVDEK